MDSRETPGPIRKGCLSVEAADTPLMSPGRVPSRLAEGRPVVLSGERAWGPNTSGTSRGREVALTLQGNYPLERSDYSMVDSFRSLIIEVGRRCAVGS